MTGADATGRGNPVPFDVRLVARIALSVAAAACLGLLAIVLLVSEGAATTYGGAIGAADTARQNLRPALFAFGLAMVAIAGMAAWFFSLYASFRIAGPLYRLSRNLELALNVGPVPPIPIRKTDCLQTEWREFEAGMTTVRLHYEELDAALAKLMRASAASGDHPEVREREWSRFKGVVSRVRY